jgi:hypothetical protein
MPEDAQIAVPSPAPTEVVETAPVAEVAAPEPKDLSELTDAERDKFMLDGTLPPKTPAPAASKEAEGDAKAEKADTKPPAEAAAATKAENQARYKELLAGRAQERAERTKAQAEAAQLRQKIAEIEGQSKVQPVKAAPETSNLPQEPRRGDYETLEEYEQAWREHPAKVVQALLAAERAAERERTESEKRAAENADILSGWESRTADAIEAAEDPKAYETAIAEAAEVIQNHPGIARYIMKNAYGPQMAAKLGQDPKALRALTRIIDPVDLADALADLKNEVRTASPKPAAPVAQPIPIRQTTPSKASPPPAQLSTANSAPADEAMAALESGDVGKYMAIMNARDLKAKRG